jgi:hypothetical protein
MIQLVKGQTIQSILNKDQSIRDHFSVEDFRNGSKILNYHNSLGKKNSFFVDLIINK